MISCSVWLKDVGYLQFEDSTKMGTAAFSRQFREALEENTDKLDCYRYSQMVSGIILEYQSIQQHVKFCNN